MSPDSTARIRPIEPTDDAALAQIVRASLAEHGLALPGTAYFDPELDHLSAFYAADSTRRAYLVAEDATGRVLGGAGLAEFSGVDDCCELQKIYLVPGARGQGLGTRLIEAVEARARELGYRRIYLETHTALAAALRLYERRGYRAVAQPVTTAHTAMNRFYLKEL